MNDNEFADWQKAEQAFSDAQDRLTAFAESRRFCLFGEKLLGASDCARVKELLSLQSRGLFVEAPSTEELAEWTAEILDVVSAYPPFLDELIEDQVSERFDAFTVESLRHMLSSTMKSCPICEYFVSEEYSSADVQELLLTGGRTLSCGCSTCVYHGMGETPLLAQIIECRAPVNIGMRAMIEDTVEVNGTTYTGYVITTLLDNGRVIGYVMFYPTPRDLVSGLNSAYTTHLLLDLDALTGSSIRRISLHQTWTERTYSEFVRARERRNRDAVVPAMSDGEVGMRVEIQMRWSTHNNKPSIGATFHADGRRIIYRVDSSCKSDVQSGGRYIVKVTEIPVSNDGLELRIVQPVVTVAARQTPDDDEPVVVSNRRQHIHVGPMGTFADLLKK